MLTSARIDLHTHTSHSEDRERIALPHDASLTMPFHPVLAPCEAYDLALERGMTHVTFTDHDTIRGGLELLERHRSPDRFIMGEEVTCYWQSIACHVGVYGLTEADHDQFHAGAARTDRERTCLRWNLPAVLAYCADQRLVCDLKHPLWVRDGRCFDREQFIALFGLFTLVEGLNGTRHRQLNELGAVLARLFCGPALGLTGGSDSHTTNIGRCYTLTTGETPAEVLDSLRAGRCEPVGPHGSHRLLEDDIRAVLAANLSQRAAGVMAFADDQIQELPLFMKELAALVLTGVVAYGVVQEYARQRALAREIEQLFAADDLEQGSNDGRTLAEQDSGGLVHGHLRRD